MRAVPTGEKFSAQVGSDVMYKFLRDSTCSGQSSSYSTIGYIRYTVRVHSAVDCQLSYSLSDQMKKLARIHFQPFCSVDDKALKRLKAFRLSNISAAEP